MAEGELTEGVTVGLGLEEADAGVELGGDVDVLVFHWEDADEGGVVRGDVGDVGVSPVAEFGAAVATGWGLGSDVGGCSGDLVHDVEH